LNSRSDRGFKKDPELRDGKAWENSRYDPSRGERGKEYLPGRYHGGSRKRSTRLSNPSIGEKKKKFGNSKLCKLLVPSLVTGTGTDLRDQKRE